MSRVSMNELTTYRWSFEEDVQNYRSAGFDGIGVWRDKLADYGEEKGADLLAESGLGVSALSWAGGFTGSDGRSHIDAIEDALDAVRLAGQLRASCLIVHSGARGGHTNNHVRRLFRSALQRVLDVAGPLQVTIALEPMHMGCAADWTFLNGLEEALDIVHAFDSPHLKLAFDSYHLGHCEGALQRLREIIPRIAIVQLGDARHAPKGEQNRCLLGHGMLPLPRIVGGLLEAGYDGYFDIELMGEEIESADYQEVLLQSRQAFDDFVASSQAT